RLPSLGNSTTDPPPTTEEGNRGALETGIAGTGAQRCQKGLNGVAHGVRLPRAVLECRALGNKWVVDRSATGRERRRGKERCISCSGSSWGLSPAPSPRPWCRVK